MQTFIASGNVIFDSRSSRADAIERKIEAQLKKDLGYEVSTFIRTASELAAIETHKPFSASDMAAKTNGLYIAFVRGTPSSDCAKALLGRRSEFDDFHIRGGEVYWLCRGRFSDSPMTGPHLERILKMPATVRNVSTIRKLLAAHFPD